MKQEEICNEEMEEVCLFIWCHGHAAQCVRADQ